MNPQKDLKEGQAAILLLRAHLSAIKRVPTILIVEDEGLDAELLADALKGFKVNIEYCSTGKDALLRISRDRVDLVLLDMQLPDLNGLEVLQAARTLPQFVVVTGSASEEQKQEALRLGALDVWHKPVTKEQLEAVFERVK